MKNLILIFTITLLFGCRMKNTMKEQQKQIIENYIRSYNDFDLTGMTKDLHDDVIFENISNGNVDLKTEGIEEFKKQGESAKQYFKERQQTIDSWRFNDQKVIVDIDYEAVLAIDLPNGMKSGDTLKLKGQSEFLFKGDRIIEIKDKS